MAMTNEEASSLYEDALAKLQAGNRDACLSILEGLERERPNSRHVTYYRAVCLAQLGRPDEAEECAGRLEGKVDADTLARLRDEISQARLREAVSNPAQDTDQNLLTVQNVYPASTEECQMQVTVRSGVFHTGDDLTIVSSNGARTTAPILRIGTGEVPLNLVRAGQTAFMVVRVDPMMVAPGSTATCEAREEVYGATMVVSSAKPGAVEGTSAMTPELLSLERMVRKGEYADAERLLNIHALQHPEHYAANRILAQVYLDAPPPLENLPLAISQIRSAYAKGGAEDPSVIHLLAEILGRNKEAAQGLRFLERLYGATQDPAARQALADRIHAYRDTFGLGHVFQFSDEYGEVVFETEERAEAEKAVAKAALPAGAKCRTDNVGEWQPVDRVFATNTPAAAAGTAPKYNPWSILVLVLLLAVLAAVILPWLLR
ncbi:MAG: hypothetical protein GXY15_08550 [Candidatus Hydrogenedentes bacterium]|nr:hypothetical protein [Candidatus Hydrogenedentota bacterium]